MDQAYLQGNLGFCSSFTQAHFQHAQIEDEETRKVKFLLSDKDEFVPEDAYIECVRAYFDVTQLFLGILANYVQSKERRFEG